MKKNKKEPLIKLSKQELNAYLSMYDEDTPDLWERIEAGFEEEVNLSENAKKYENKLVSLNKKVKRMRLATVIAACVLITVIAVPVFIFSNMHMGRKSESDQMVQDTNAGGYSDDTDKSMAEKNDAVNNFMSDEINSSDERGEDAAGKSEQTDLGDNYEYVDEDESESMSENDAASPTESPASTDRFNTEIGPNATTEDTEMDFDAFMVRYESCMQVMKGFMD